jgi:hypothetical protein
MPEPPFTVPFSSPSQSTPSIPSARNSRSLAYCGNGVAVAFCSATPRTWTAAESYRNCAPGGLVWGRSSRNCTWSGLRIQGS